LDSNKNSSLAKGSSKHLFSLHKKVLQIEQKKVC
jgi:hypothetical protein